MRAPDLPPLSARALEIERLVIGEPRPAPVYPRDKKTPEVLRLNRIRSAIKAQNSRREKRREKWEKTQLRLQSVL